VPKYYHESKDLGEEGNIMEAGEKYRNGDEKREEGSLYPANFEKVRVGFARRKERCGKRHFAWPRASSRSGLW
jgi:hypothetical protein